MGVHARELKVISHSVQWRLNLRVAHSLIPFTNNNIFLSLAGDGSVVCVNEMMSTSYELSGPDCDAVYRVVHAGSDIFTSCRDGYIRSYSNSWECWEQALWVYSNSVVYRSVWEPRDKSLLADDLHIRKTSSWITHDTIMLVRRFIDRRQSKLWYTEEYSESTQGLGGFNAWLWLLNICYTIFL